MRPVNKTLINARNLKGADGVWGDGGACSGDVSKLVGSLTNLRGNLSALNGHVSANLSGDMSHLRGDITGLWGRVGHLDNVYTFRGHGGDVSILREVDLYIRLDATIDRPVHEWALFLFAAYFMRAGEEEYDPQAFRAIVVEYGLEKQFIELAPAIAEQEGVEILDALLTSLTD